MQTVKSAAAKCMHKCNPQFSNLNLGAHVNDTDKADPQNRVEMGAGWTLVLDLTLQSSALGTSASYWSSLGLSFLIHKVRIKMLT